MKGIASQYSRRVCVVISHVCLFLTESFRTAAHLQNISIFINIGCVDFAQVAKQNFGS